MVGFTGTSLDPSSPPPSSLVQLPPIASAVSPTSEAATSQNQSAYFDDDQIQTRLLLSHYDSSLAAQGKLPPKSRVNPEMVQRKPPPPLRFGLRSLAAKVTGSGDSTPRGESVGSQSRRRSSQRYDQQGLETSSQREYGKSNKSQGVPDVVFRPDRENNDLTLDDRKALGAQKLDDELAPGSTSRPMMTTTYHTADLEDDEGSQRDDSGATSETARGLIRWVYDNWYDFGWMIGRKSFDIGWSLLKFGVTGGPKKSWGIEMTLVAAIMRNLSAHSSLADITLVRNLISIHHLLPLPPDAIVTPITFTIRKRGKHEALQGFLSELDAMNTGNRELSGEWVVNKDVWARLKAKKKERDRQKSAERERRARGLPSLKRGSSRGLNREGEKIIYYIHGGKCILSINYRLAPESRFPEPLLDVVYGYFRLVESLKIDPQNIASLETSNIINLNAYTFHSQLVMGDSAGGGLSLALSMYLRDAGYKHLLPRGLVLMSPWVDLTMSCGSWDENAPYDVVPQPGQGDHLNPVACYLGPEGIKQYLTHPYASPLFGDFHDLPPMLIQAGDSEVLRDEITLLAHKATLAGVNIKHEMYVDQVHVFQSFPFQAAAGVAFRSIAKFAASLREPEPRVEPETTANAAAQPANLDSVSRSASMDTVSRSVTPTDIDTVASEMEHGQTKLVKGDGTEIDIDFSDTEADAQGAQVPPPQSRQTTSLPDNPRTADLQTASDPEPQATKPIIRRAFPSFSRTKAPSGISTSFQKPLDGIRTTPPSSEPPSPVIKSASAASTLRTPRRSRHASISSQLTLSPAKPTTRLRSQSHVDMVQLVETYNRAGGANQTMVFTPSNESSTFDFPSTPTSGKEGGGLQLDITE
ncbi:hypothetical protein QFC21_000647 [Naganishia friedmannii]|uniref:Uncharacterized protein n=1 Tax=Naganishia friedmannii TaxID=89922 RepID=A0ACC2WCW9_9TREE|nr:hypothetical protein QFC21_000647 [Naganishia friedmannii]